MSNNCVSINIEGDFIDSFIYSGTLFLVHADSKITTYDWDALITSANYDDKCKELTYNFLKDCRTSAQITDRDPKTIYIDKDKLEEKCISTLRLDGWPTDINIFANSFYIASESGVEELEFKWQEKTIETAGRFHVWRKYAYKVSADYGHRLAIAAGPNGVITVYPRKGYIIKECDISTLLEIDSHDCEWIGRSLIANSLDGTFLSTFPDLPKIPKGNVPHDFWTLYDEIKRKSPQRAGELRAVDQMLLCTHG